MKVDPGSIPPWQFSFIKASDFAPYFRRAQQQSLCEQNKGQGEMVQRELQTRDLPEAYEF